MSTFSLQVKLCDLYLLVTGHGSRNSLNEVLEGTQQIAKVIAETNCRYLLVDYSQVKTKLPVADAFNIVRIYESKVSEFQHIVMAIIINPAEEQFDSFWEKICRIRGYQFKIFTDPLKAENWLKDKAEKH